MPTDKNEIEEQELEKLIHKIISKEALFSFIMNLADSALVETVQAWGKKYSSSNEVRVAEMFAKNLRDLLKAPDESEYPVKPELPIKPIPPIPPYQFIETDDDNIMEHRQYNHDLYLYKVQLGEYESKVAYNQLNWIYNSELKEYNEKWKPFHAYQEVIAGILMSAQETMKTTDKKTPEESQEEASRKEKFLAYLKQNPDIANFMKDNIDKLNDANDSFLKFSDKTRQQYVKQEYAQGLENERIGLREKGRKEETATVLATSVKSSKSLEPNKTSEAIVFSSLSGKKEKEKDKLSRGLDVEKANKETKDMDNISKSLYVDTRTTYEASPEKWFTYKERDKQLKDISG